MDKMSPSRYNNCSYVSRDRCALTLSQAFRMAGDQRSLEATAGLVSSPPHHWRSSPNLSREQTPDSMGTFRQRRHQSPDNRRGYYLPNQQNPENAALFCQGSLDNESLGGGNPSSKDKASPFLSPSSGVDGWKSLDSRWPDPAADRLPQPPGVTRHSPSGQSVRSQDSGFSEAGGVGGLPVVDLQVDRTRSCELISTCDKEEAGWPARGPAAHHHVIAASQSRSASEQHRYSFE